VGHDISDQRIMQYIAITERLKRGDYDMDDLPPMPPDDLSQLGQALHELAARLAARRREINTLERITAQINAGLLLGDILDNVYHDFREIIPYNRIGFSLIEPDGVLVRARWAKSDQPRIRLGTGYAAPLAGSSLQDIITTGQPRIINDLVDYLARKPNSKSTRLIVEEGFRSSLTCPLIANGYPVGFIFFSSTEPHAYSDVHVEVFMRIAEQLSVIVDKGQLVSELATRQAEIEARNEELSHLNDLKNTFIGMAAHDLRNPIGAIQMMTQFLRDPISNFSFEERDRLYTNMLALTQQMLTMLDELLDVTQIEAGKLELRYQIVDVHEFLAESIEMHAQLAAPKGTRVILDAVEPGSVQADPHRLRQVIDNLVSNAVKYSPPGSMVRVRAARVPSGWRIEVEDQGPGIKPEEHALLFQDFSRLSARPTGEESSTGLGLAISRRVIEAHGGQIGVAGASDGGSIFWFTLPD
jgi:signal transduction histidine kinase